jgi:thioredoxin-like negative regulator of GroEL
MVMVTLLLALAAVGPSDAAVGRDLDARLDALIFREPARIPEIIANGRPSLLVFTDHHCAACLSMVPTVERLVAAYEGRANVVTIDPQDPNLAVRLLSAKYGVWGTPMVVLLDHTGAVRKKLYGPQREKSLAAEMDRAIRAKR